MAPSTSSPAVLPAVAAASAPSVFHTFVSGAAGQAVELLTLGHVLDRIKIEQQSQPGLRSIRETVHIMRARGGIAELYRGLRWNLVLGSLRSATRWVINNKSFEFCERTLPSQLKRDYPATFSACVACVAAVFETTFVICPLESLKVREMTTLWQRSGDQSRVRMAHVMRTEGLSLLWRGWDRVLAKQVISWVAYLVGYQEFKQLAVKYNSWKYKTQPGSQPYPLSLAQKVWIGAATGALSSLLHTPVDMLKTQAQQAHPLAPSGGLGKWGVITRIIWEKYGLIGFYSSLRVKIVRSVWYSVVTLLAMDYLDALPSHMKLK